MAINNPAPDAPVRAELGTAAAFFHGLADPTRLAILRRLMQGEARVVDLTAQFGLAQSTISAHVACLRDCALVTGRAEGRQMFYSLARPELIDVLTSAESLLAVVGERVDLCTHHGTNDFERHHHHAGTEVDGG